MPSQTCQKCGSASEKPYCEFCLLQMAVLKPSATTPASVSISLPTIEELNQRFPQLEVTELIGRGGMGAIYRARQTSLDRDVALKLIAREVSSDPAFTERFEREAKTLAKLSHPNIVTVYDFGYTSDGMAYLVMEFVEGINLREALRSQSVLAEDAMAVISDMCRALEYAHTRGVIHRDIKPENILLGEDGTLKIVDFGIAKIVDESLRVPTLTATSQVLGSLHYLAPEQIESPNQVDHRVDLYALGVVFYEMLAGQLPLGRYEQPSAVNPQIDTRLDAIVLKLLSRKPTDRFQTAREVEMELAALQRQVASAAIETTPPPLPHSQPLSDDSRRSSSTSVPFTYDTMAGFAEAVGMIYGQGSTLVVEFRNRDKLLGTLRSKTQLVTIPSHKLTRLELKSGVFSSTLTIAANSLSALGNLPGSETGSIELKIKRVDVAAAKQLVHQLGFSRSGSLVTDREKPLLDQSAYTQQVIFGALMILCGILNLGGLAIGQVINANSAHSNPSQLAVVAIAISVMVGPAAVMQLVGGILNFVLPMETPNKVLTTISLIPMTPAWPLSCPAAIWLSPWIQSKLRLGNGLKNSWGATTIMFLRETRWSRAVAIGNAIAACTIGFLLLMFYGGHYHSTLQYRVVGATENAATELLQQVQSRLIDIAGSAAVSYDAANSRLVIKGKKRLHPAIVDCLQIEKAVELAWLEPITLADGSDKRLLPMDAALPVNDLATEPGLAINLVTTQPLLKLVESMVASTREASTSNLQIELTSAGREQLRQTSSQTGCSLGLIIDGLVVGIAPPDKISNKAIYFQLDPHNQITASSLSAALRGPTLDCDLELLNN